MFPGLCAVTRQDSPLPYRLCFHATGLSRRAGRGNEVQDRTLTLQAILWRQWKRTWTRMQNLRKRGLAEDRATASASNGRGPCWNAGASHMNEAYPKKYFDQRGLLSLLDEIKRQPIMAT